MIIVASTPARHILFVGEHGSNPEFEQVAKEANLMDHQWTVTKSKSAEGVVKALRKLRNSGIPTSEVAIVYQDGSSWEDARDKSKGLKVHCVYLYYKHARRVEDAIDFVKAAMIERMPTT